MSLDFVEEKVQNIQKFSEKQKSVLVRELFNQVTQGFVHFLCEKTPLLQHYLVQKLI